MRKRTQSGHHGPFAHYGGPVADTTRDLTVVAADGEALALSVREPAEPRSGQAALPVLLLHGLSQQRHFWTPVIERLRTRPVAALDQRGHGDSDTPIDADYSIAACADDVRAALDALGWDQVVLCGHSWGGAVALAATAAMPDRVVAAELVDGGLWSLSGLGPRAQVRERLRPPVLDLPIDDLWARIRAGDLGETWSQETQDALGHTFVVDDSGRARTRIGIDRHMRVLDGMLDYDPTVDLTACEATGVPIWAVVCERSGARDVPTRDNLLVHRWAGAIHDVPLQWPALVAGFVDALVESREAR